MNKTAFLKGFMDRLTQERRAKARRGYEAAKAGWHEATSHHPIPQHHIKKWDEEFEEVEKVGLRNHTRGHGWNHFADRINPWLETPEGKKWNEAQAKKRPK